jgi:hypothetical protein
MKKLILISAFFVAFFAAKSQTILTDAQKDQCLNDPTFQSEVKWGILNKAAYWEGQDGTAVPGGQTAANLKKWAQARALAAQLQNNPSSAENLLYVKQFLIYAKTTAVWEGSVSATVTYMLTNSIFDSLADTWFTNMSATTPF